MYRSSTVNEIRDLKLLTSPQQQQQISPPSALKTPLNQKFMPMEVLVQYKINIEFPSSSKRPGRSSSRKRLAIEKRNKVQFEEEEKEIPIMNLNLQQSSSMQHEAPSEMNPEVQLLRQQYQLYLQQRRAKQEGPNSQPKKLKNTKSCCQVM